MYNNGDYDGKNKMQMRFPQRDTVDQEESWFMVWQRIVRELKTCLCKYNWKNTLVGGKAESIVVGRVNCGVFPWGLALIYDS